ncbi:MAG TPA: nitroreductase family protein [Candidatus Nanoarchaeia archaeon]|nr:nitroreductase family protein [Candidatus Nanoarchaeia archaeon]
MELLTVNQRKSDHDINEIFLNRWSPRAMSGDPISNEELMQLFEAARWAPSSFNNQPWRFIYATRDSEYWQSFLELLVDFNRSWAKNAAVLVALVSKKNFEYNGKPSITHSFDTGAAWENLALQGSLNNLVVHGMEGFDYKKAKKVLGIPKDYQVEMMFAVGMPGKIEDLPKELAEKEHPSGRKELSEFVFKGTFRGN